MLNEVKSRLLSGKKLSMIIFVIVLLIFGCDKQGILKFKALGSIEIKFVTNKTKTDWPDEFPAHIVVEGDDFDTIEKDLTIIYNPSDSIYKAVEVVEIPVEKRLDLTVTALINGDNWEGHSDIYLDPNQTRIVEILMEKIIPDGLIAYYPFNGNADDESGNGNNGINNGATPTEDRFGNPNSAYYFDGVDNYIRVENPSEEVRIAGDLSFSTWAFLDGYVTTGARQIITCKGFGESIVTNVLYRLEILDDHKIRTWHEYENGLDQIITFNTIFPTGIWKHTLVVRDTTNKKYKLYFDGVFVEEQFYNHNPEKASSGNTQYLEFSGPGELVWYGKIDDICIYNRILSESEIDSLFHIGGWSGGTGTVTDIDGNLYQTIKIGDQWWMAENLKVTHYRNGDSIPEVTDNSNWSGLTTCAYCNYDNDVGNVDTYGRLYNWYAVDDSCGIAPEGWHIPTDDEWQTLVDYLGGSSVAGGKMKESGTTHWISPNTGATNESGFTALPGGYRGFNNGIFYYMGDRADVWSSSEYGSNYAWYRRLDYDSSGVYRSSNYKRFGFSVRCVRD